MRLAVLAAIWLASVPSPAVTSPRTVTLSVVGTNDLHGAVLEHAGRGGLALFAGYLANLRRARTADGGAVLLIDAGDLFQGTLESNLSEGAVVVRAYNALGYDAAAIGNHEFDYGPVGPAATPAAPGDDPVGALKARALEANFPFLAANLIDRATGMPIAWQHVQPSVVVRKAGITIGLIGVTTAATLDMTVAANVRGLRIAPLAATIVREASSLRDSGARLVVVAAHAGGACRDFSDPASLASCQAGAEIVAVAETLDPSLIDLIVAGHTHQGMAQLIHGIPVVEAFASGVAFSRVDFVLDPDKPGRALSRHIEPPREICARVRRGTSSCASAGALATATVPASYEGARVLADPAIAALLEPAVDAVKSLRDRPLGVRVAERLTRSYGAESALGNLLADLMLAARPTARVAIQNGGGIRADLQAGPLSYGDLYAVYPFDNRFAHLRLTGAELKRRIARNLASDDGVWSIAGLRATASCRDGALIVEAPIGDDETVEVVTSDFLATSGELAGLAGGAMTAMTIEDAPLLRDEIARVLSERGGTLRPRDWLDPARPRIAFPGPRPVRCDARPRPSPQGSSGRTHSRTTPGTAP